MTSKKKGLMNSPIWMLLLILLKSSNTEEHQRKCQDQPLLPEMVSWKLKVLVFKLSWLLIWLSRWVFQSTLYWPWLLLPLIRLVDLFQHQVKVFWPLPENIMATWSTHLHFWTSSTERDNWTKDWNKSNLGKKQNFLTCKKKPSWPKKNLVTNFPCMSSWKRELKKCTVNQRDKFLMLRNNGVIHSTSLIQELLHWEEHWLPST